MRRFELDDDRCRRIEHLPPGDPDFTARDNRLSLDAVLWVVRTRPLGGPADAVRQARHRLPAVQPVGQEGGLGGGDGRPRRRRRSGGPAHRFEGRARPQARRRGPKKNGDQAVGRSRGGLTTKLHATADALGDPVRPILGDGQAHDMSQARALIAGLESDYVIADKGYDGGPFVKAIEAGGVRAVIPSRSNRREPRMYGVHLYRERNQIERLFARLKECRRVATRYEKTARNYLAFCQLASVMVLLA